MRNLSTLQLHCLGALKIPLWRLRSQQQDEWLAARHERFTLMTMAPQGEQEIQLWQGILKAVNIAKIDRCKQVESQALVLGKGELPTLAAMITDPKLKRVLWKRLQAQ